METSGKKTPFDLAPPSILDLIQWRGKTQERRAKKPLPLALHKDWFLKAIHKSHCLWAALPINLPHFAFMCFSHIWSLLQVSLKDLQTQDMLESPAGESLPRTMSRASSGKSRTEGNISFSPSFSPSLWLLLLLDILMERFRLGTRSSQCVCFKGRDLERRKMKGREDKSRKNIASCALSQQRETPTKSIKSSQLSTRTRIKIITFFNQRRKDWNFFTACHKPNQNKDKKLGKNGRRWD